MNSVLGQALIAEFNKLAIFLETVGWIIFIAAALWVLNLYLQVKHQYLHDRISLFFRDYWDNLKNYFK